MGKITKLKAREILDSRGNPTVAVDLVLDEKFSATAAVPSGASTGKYEAMELRDGEKARFGGKGVLKAVENVQEVIKEAVLGKEFEQAALDQVLIDLDGTENKANLGANAILGVSLAFARATAQSRGQELYQYLNTFSQGAGPALPQPMFNIINGGKHADSGLDIQEFMLAPLDFPNFREKVRAGAEIFHALEEILKSRGHKTSVGDEGGFAPELVSNEEALDLVVEAIGQAGYSTNQVKIGLDCAASSFYDSETEKYVLKIGGRPEKIGRTELLDWYRTLAGRYPLYLIEDGFAEDDWEGFVAFNQSLGGEIVNVGDDLLVTNIKRIQQAIEKSAVNSVLIKLNQIGTLSETAAAISLTKQQGWQPFVSHRSGETEDTFIADLASGLACPLIKSGSLSRTERICKYNRLMLIEEQLNEEN